MTKKWYEELDIEEKFAIEGAIQGRYEYINRPFFVHTRNFNDVKKSHKKQLLSYIEENYPLPIQSITEEEISKDLVNITVETECFILSESNFKEIRSFPKEDNLNEKYGYSFASTTLTYEEPGFTPDWSAAFAPKTKERANEDHWIYRQDDELGATVLAMLVGGDLKKIETEKFELNFVFFAPKKSKAKKLAKELGKEYSTYIDDANKDEIVVEAMIEHVAITEEWYVATVDYMRYLANKYDSEYDGWYGRVED